MEQPTKFQGWWWLPQNPDKKIPGTITIQDGQDTVLELMGVFSDDENWLLSQEAFQEIPLLVGVTERSTEVVCFSCKFGGANEYHPGNYSFPPVWGFSSITYRVQTFITKTHPDSNGEVLFKSITVDFSNLNHWLDAPSRITFTQPEVDYQNFNVNTATIELISFELEDGVTLVAKSLASRPDTFNRKYGIEEYGVFNIRCEQGKPFDYFYTIIQHLQDFLTLAMNQPARLLSVQGTTTKNSQLPHHPSSKIYCQLRYTPEQSKHKLRGQMRFTFEQIKDEMPTIFKAFLEESHNYDLAYFYYFTVATKEYYAEHQFLLYMQAIEGFCRRFYDDTKYMPKAEFKNNVAKPLIEQIPANLEEKLSKSLADAIYRANDFSLRERLEKLLNEFTPEFVGSLIDIDDKVQQQFSKNVVDVRNYLTHLLEPIPNYGEIIFRALPRLKVILEICLLKMMGFSHEKIESLLEYHLSFKDWSSTI